MKKKKKKDMIYMNIVDGGVGSVTLRVWRDFYSNLEFE